jgi:hypothetical protein
MEPFSNWYGSESEISIADEGECRLNGKDNASNIPTTNSAPARQRS